MLDVKLKRGFVTLATGNEYYYQLASNMLHSYKLWNKEEKYPFAILCDRENEYTKEFDDVIIINPEHGNYASKFELLLHSPYQENIFIEPDCLIYRNISCLWDFLSAEFDFTAFGWNDGKTEVWFTEEASKHLSVDKIPIFNPGYLFIRPGEKCQKLYEDCIIIANYLERNKEKLPKCYVGKTLRDDPVLAVAMQWNDCKCPAKPKLGKLLSLPSEKLVCAHISKGLLKTESCDEGNLLHFSTKRTKQGLYKQQVKVMELCLKDAAKWKINFMESGVVLKILELFCKVRNYLKNL
jgi:hypothetical protein